MTPRYWRRRRAGDRQALETLLVGHYDRVHAVCRRILGNEADAVDAAQDALLSAVRAISRFDGRSSFGTWLYRIATNACLDELRRRRRRPVVGLPADVDGDWDRPGLGGPGSWHGGSGGAGGHPDAFGRGGRDPADEAAARVDVDAALRLLATEHRVALVLRDLCDLTYDEIAVILDVPIGTVRSRIARGRAALADVMTGGRRAGTDRTGGNRTPEGTRRRPPSSNPVTGRKTARHDPREHLSDEQLSAQLDGELHPARPGEPDAGAGAHLAACASCRRRRAALADARALVGTPVVPVTPSVKAAAVAAALAGGLPEERIAGRPPAVTVLASRRPAPRLLVGAAAAVALLVVGVGVSLGLTHGVALPHVVGHGGHGSASTSTAALGTPQASAVRPAASGTSLAGSRPAEGSPPWRPCPRRCTQGRPGPPAGVTGRPEGLRDDELGQRPPRRPSPRRAPSGWPTAWPAPRPPVWRRPRPRRPGPARAP